MHKYRTHRTVELGEKNLKEQVKVSGWINKKRDHGGLIFIDVRDHFGMVQIVVDNDKDFFAKAEKIRTESVITVAGTVVKRSDETINENLPTGTIEILAEDFVVESEADPITFMMVSEDEEVSDEVRLKYRFLDLRRATLQKNIALRSEVISFIRAQMISLGFLEVHTPILTSSSPEGARDFVVPSRKHPGKFYALPQAPQQFKQLLMVSGFDRYFQIAPCFRDEDARADRTPGEFYQLDLEMSFATQEDVFDVVQTVLYNTFSKFGNKEVTKTPFPQIPYKEAIAKYGSDKPDLRNPIEMSEVADIFAGSNFTLFADLVAKGNFVKAIPAPNSAEMPRSFFDKLNEWAQKEKQGGLGYIIFAKDGTAKGPIASKLDEEKLAKLKEITGVKDGDSLFFVCGNEKKDIDFSGLARNKIARELGLIDENKFEFCWITDFPMYELNEETGKVDFCHNPFSMPQGGLEALETKNPLDIYAFQYDIVCNGVEISSGAIRNHRPEIMYKAFEIAGYGKEVVDNRFGGMIRAFKYGAPPHGGSAPGIERILMLLTDGTNLRDVIPFPLNQQGEDLLMNAPNDLDASRLEELHIKLDIKEKK